MVSDEDLGLLEFARDGLDAWAILKQTGMARRGPHSRSTTSLLAEREKGATYRPDLSSSLEFRRRTVSQNEPICGRNLRGFATG